MSIDRVFFRVVQIRTFAGDKNLTNATGFFFLDDNFLFLITNRHVVLSEPTDHRPDSVRVALHIDGEDLTKTSEIVVPLYVGDIPQWREHPTCGAEVDVVAIPINDPQVLAKHVVETFSAEEIHPADSMLPIGQEVVIVGFPLGFHDTMHHLPIVRSASIANSYSHPFKGFPYFLTDARMHRGTSGSPVIAKLWRASEVAGERERAWFLLGVHSSALDVSNRNPDLDEKLGLNTAWYAELIPKIVRGEVEPSAELETKPPQENLTDK